MVAGFAGTKGLGMETCAMLGMTSASHDFAAAHARHTCRRAIAPPAALRVRGSDMPHPPSDDGPATFGIEQQDIVHHGRGDVRGINGTFVVTDSCPLLPLLPSACNLLF